MNVIRHTPPPPSASTPSVPAELDALVARALAKPVESRPSGALALSSDLRRIAATLDARERDVELPPRPRAREAQEGSGWLAAGCVGGGILVLIAAVWWICS